MPQPYRMPREGAGRRLTLEEELDASSVFDPYRRARELRDHECCHTTARL